MSKRKTIPEHLPFSLDVVEGPYEGLADRLMEYRDKVPLGAQDVRLEIDHGWEGVEGLLLSWKRLESDKEYEARISREAAALRRKQENAAKRIAREQEKLKNAEQEERALYESLHEKYGGK